MANPKILNGRIVMKHDTAGNWALATNFRPLPGELIIYEPDETHPYPRFKVGVAEDPNANPVVGKLISELPFADEHLSIVNSDWSESDPTNPAYVKNRTHYVQYFYETLMQEFYFNVAEKITHELTGQLLYDGTIIRSEIGTTLRLTLFNYNSEESKTYEGKVRFLVETGYVVDFQDENNNIVCSIVQSLHDFGVYESNKTYIYNLDAGTYDILIEGPTETVIKLDKKFLPDDIVYLSDIEELTIEEIDEICGATIVSLQDVQY